MDYRELVERYDESGLLMLDGFLSASRVDEIERELRAYIEQTVPGQEAGRVIYEPGTERTIRNIFHLHQDSEYFAALARDRQFVDLARAIFDDEPLLISVELFGKPARVGSEVPFHQDNAYFNLTPDDALTCWVALADATEENGCVRYLEGSHKYGNLPHKPSGVKGNSMGLVDVPPDAGPEICGLVRRGGVLIHHCNTIHRSEPNRSDRNRPGLLLVYKAARCRVDPELSARYRAAATRTVNA